MVWISQLPIFTERGQTITEKKSTKTIYAAELGESGFYQVDVDVSQDISINGGLPLRLRLAPGDRPGNVVITDLAVILQDLQGQETVVMSAISSKELAAMITRSNEVLVAHKASHLWRVDQFDPWIELTSIKLDQVFSGNAVSVRYHLMWREMPDTESLTLLR